MKQPELTRILLTVTLFAYTIAANAQMRTFKSHDIKVSDEFKTKNEVQRFLGIQDNYLYIQTAQRKFFTLRSPNLHKINKSTLEDELSSPLYVEYKGKNLLPHGGYLFGGKLVGIGSSINKETQTNYQFVQELDLGTLKPKGELIRVSEYKFSSNASDGDAKITVDFTLDKQYMIVTARAGYAKKNEPAEIAIAVVDTGLNVVWSEQVQFDIPFKNLNIQDIATDAEGNGFLLVEEKLKNQLDSRYRFYIKRPNQKIIERTIDTENQGISNASILVYEDRLFASGLYRDLETKRKDIKGLFIVELDKENFNVIERRTYDLDPSRLLEGIGPLMRFVMKITFQRATFDDFKVEKILPLEDGSHLALFQRQYILSGYNYSTGLGNASSPGLGSVHSGRSTYRSFRGDIVAIKLSAKGEFDWVEHIKARQNIRDAKDEIYMNFVTCTDTNNLYVIFNSHEKNYKKYEKTYGRSKPKSFNGNPEKSFIEIVSFDLLYGDVNRERLLREKEKETIVLPAGSEMQDGACFLYTQSGTKKKKKRYVTIKMEH